MPTDLTRLLTQQENAALREALEIDPALTGVDLLYAEGLLGDMMEAQKEKLPRFF